MLRINSATKNLLLTLISWSEEWTSAKQMLHGVYPEIAEGFSMTRQRVQLPHGDLCFLGALCVFARVIPSRQLELPNIG